MQSGYIEKINALMKESPSEEILKAIYKILQTLSKPTGPSGDLFTERKNREAEETNNAKRQNIERNFAEWCSRIPKKDEIPERWQVSGVDVTIAAEYAFVSGQMPGEAVDAFWAMYRYGFKRGVSYQKRNKRKQGGKAC